MTTFHGYTETQEQIDARMERRKAEHAAALKEAQERRQEGHRLADELLKTLEPAGPLARFQPQADKVNKFVAEHPYMAATISGTVSVASALTLIYIVEAVLRALGG